MQNLDWFFLDAVRHDIRQARQSTGVASPLEHAFYPGVHFFFLDKFAPVSLFEALWDARSKAHVLSQQPQRRVFHELRRVHSFLRGDSGETRFLFGCESDFHESSD